jgi:formylglycine-generating enzyme
LGAGYSRKVERCDYSRQPIQSCCERVTRRYRPNYNAHLASTGGATRNPVGPTASFDLSEPTTKKRVHRGGSFLCSELYCSRYMIGTRGKGDVTTGTNHLEFRLVATADQSNSLQAAA